MILQLGDTYFFSFHILLLFLVGVTIFLKQNIIPISESGINCAEDLESLRSIGIMGVLIGETFMRETDIEQSFKKLFNSI